MRLRTLSFLGIGFCACVLTACETPDMLPPSEVLRRAAFAGQRLDSAALRGSFEGIIDAEGRTPLSFSLSAHGGFADRGAMSSIDIDGWMKVSGNDRMNFSGAVAQIPTGEWYVRGGGDVWRSVFPNLPRTGSGTWHRMSSAASGSAIAPDPQAIERMLELVDVTNVRDFERSPSGVSYHYDVLISPDKLRVYLDTTEIPQGIAGEIVIDAETFFVRRIEWTLLKSPTSFGPLDASIIVEFSEFNAYVPSSFPAVDET